MYYKKILIPLVVFCLNGVPCLTQPDVMTVDELMALALKESPLRKAAALESERQGSLIRTATRLPDPELIVESPTGDFFVAGVEQTFEFPTVYTRHKQIARQRLLAAENQEVTTDRQLRWHIRQHYLEWQYAMAWLQYCQVRDSVFRQIQVLSDRQFAAGEMDAVEKSLARVKYTEAHASLLEAEQDVRVVRSLLEPFASGLEDKIPTDFHRETMSAPEDWESFSDSFDVARHWMLNEYRIEEVLAGKEVQLQKAKRLPDFRVGYLNQGVRHNPFVMGLRLGISIPLPTGAQKASEEAASLEHERIGQQYQQAIQDIRTEWNEALQKFRRYQQTIEFLSTNGLDASHDLIRGARRMYEAGQYDLIRFFLVVTESFAIQEMYLQNILEYQRTRLQLHFLNGTI